MKTAPIALVEFNVDEMQQLLHRAKAVLTDKDYQIVEAVVQSYAYVTDLLEDKRITLSRLRKALFGSGSEKTRDVVPQTQAVSTLQPGAAPTAPVESPPEQTARARGHGRNGADEYRSAEKVPVPHGSLRSGDSCPECQQGTVYALASPGVLVRIVGQAPVQAKVYELQKLRCHLCGKMFTAAPPEGVGEDKYDATAGSMIALLKYGSGLPFNRLSRLQETLGIPLPASTQWDIVRDAARLVVPAYRELIRQAAQGQVLHNDDTTIKILEFMGKRARKANRSEDPSHERPGSGAHEPTSASSVEPQRCGMFTSGIVSTNEGRRIALFFSGRKHAGENLADVLVHRAATLAPPIQMCDALSRNLPGELKTILANCLAHGRRQFVDVAERFPEECRYVLEMLGEVYKNDAAARERNLSAQARLAFHQAHSGPIMERLQAWGQAQFEQRLVEPNSALGEAISYLLRHWEKLTLFLRQAGAPLDNNIAERALKKAILHRKNSLFYKTRNGAHVGDIFMSLIYTCQFCGADPFDYLTQLQCCSQDLGAQPENWMPWNYSSRQSAPESGRDESRA